MNNNFTNSQVLYQQRLQNKYSHSSCAAQALHIRCSQ